MSSQFSLLKQRRFAPFFGVQFFGAMNDNVFKMALSGLLSYKTIEYTSLPEDVAQNLVAALFILPFALLSATSGQIVDKFDKRILTRWVKIFEVLITLVGLVGFYFHSFAILLVCIVGLGIHSAFFGPIKYAYLPQHLKSEELLGGNALIEASSLIAIVLGTILGSGLAVNVNHGHIWVALLSCALALCGLSLVRFVPACPPADPTLTINHNIFSETWKNLSFLKQQRTLFLSVLGISWFWLLGGLFLIQLPSFVKNALSGDALVLVCFQAIFAIGVAIGSVACEKLSGKQVEIGLVPFGSIGMTLAGIDLYFSANGLLWDGKSSLLTLSQFFSSWQHWRIALDLLVLAIFSGFYCVPLYALVQLRSKASHQARMIAANNILNALFMVAGAGLAVVCLKVFQFSIVQLFLLTAILNALVAVYIYSLVPEFLLRFIAWILVHTMYRMKKTNTHLIPAKGAAVLVCNHISFVDPVILMAISPRPIRFIMDHRIHGLPVIGWMFRQLKTIPIAPAKENPAMMERAFELAGKALDEGELLCIFPEGRITDTGEMYPFRPGITRILNSHPVPVIPMALRGLWGSFFSRKYGKAMTRFRGFFSRIEVVVERPVSPEAATPAHLQEIVTKLRGDWK